MESKYDPTEPSKTDEIAAYAQVVKVTDQLYNEDGLTLPEILEEFTKELQIKLETIASLNSTERTDEVLGKIRSEKAWMRAVQRAILQLQAQTGALRVDSAQ
jgi:hypothetical protein